MLRMVPRRNRSIQSSIASWVAFNLTQIEFRIFAANASSRVEELTKEIENVLTIYKLKKLAANKLRGRMQFAANQIFGRLSRRYLKAVSEYAMLGNNNISFPTSMLLKEFVTALFSNRPRCIDISLCKTWFIFINTFYESES